MNHLIIFILYFNFFVLSCKYYLRVFMHFSTMLFIFIKIYSIAYLYKKQLEVTEATWRHSQCFWRSVNYESRFWFHQFKSSNKMNNVRVVLKPVPTKKLRNISCKILLQYIWKCANQYTAVIQLREVSLKKKLSIGFHIN